MYRIIDKRGTGKTSRLMLLAKEENAIIACSNPDAMRIKAERLPRHGRYSAYAFVGLHDSGRSAVSSDRSLDDDHAWSGNSLDGARLHPAG